ncbi:secretion protein Por, partial [Candidatus Wolfebacteria bacterium CG_4_10_14_0_8_um_filter_37_11]
IFPELVTTDNNGYKGISYEKIVPVLTEAIKDQQKEIKELKARIEILERK